MGWERPCSACWRLGRVGWGIAGFVVDTMAHNTKMLRVFHAGLPVTSEFKDGVIHVMIELGEGATP